MKEGRTAFVSFCSKCLQHFLSMFLSRDFCSIIRLNYYRPKSHPFKSYLFTQDHVGPRQANLVLIAYASSEISGEPAHCAVSPEPSLLAHTSSESSGTFRQKARSLAPLNGWACAVKICHDRMLEDTNSFDGAHVHFLPTSQSLPSYPGWHSHRYLLIPSVHVPFLHGFGSQSSISAGEKWGTAWQNQQNNVLPTMTRSAYASVQSDQSLLCAQWIAKDHKFLQADSKASDETGWLPRPKLIRSGWSESSLGAQVILLVLLWCSSNAIDLWHAKRDLGVLQFVKPDLWFFVTFSIAIYFEREQQRRALAKLRGDAGLH